MSYFDPQDESLDGSSQTEDFRSCNEDEMSDSDLGVKTGVTDWSCVESPATDLPEKKASGDSDFQLSSAEDRKDVNPAKNRRPEEVLGGGRDHALKNKDCEPSQSTGFFAAGRTYDIHDYTDACKCDSGDLLKGADASGRNSPSFLTIENVEKHAEQSDVSDSLGPRRSIYTQTVKKPKKRLSKKTSDSLALPTLPIQKNLVIFEASNESHEKSTEKKKFPEKLSNPVPSSSEFHKRSKERIRSPEKLPYPVPSNDVHEKSREGVRCPKKPSYYVPSGEVHEKSRGSIGCHENPPYPIPSNGVHEKSRGSVRCSKKPSCSVPRSEVHEKSRGSVRCPEKLPHPVPSNEALEKLRYNMMHQDKHAVYGHLFVIGCNGAVPPHLKGSIQFKYTLRKRPEPNGLKEAFSCTKPNEKPNCSNSTEHAISYPMSDNHSLVVAYKPDKMTDMFQIGRYEKPPVDFRVTNVNYCDQAKKGVSRFACRIVVRRDGNHQARVYASAFDPTNNIFLGEGGFTCKQGRKMDGFTTNGVLVMHPVDHLPGVWREVSVCGYIHPLRSPKYESAKRPRIFDESNVLQDGTLIDLCGVTLLWRTREGLNNAPDGEYLSRLQTVVHNEVPICLPLSYRVGASCDQPANGTKKAFVFLSCGHVVGLALSKPPKNVEGWTCPVCKAISHIVELKMGVERGFYADREFPGYIFKPCGHAASLGTVKYWSAVKIPCHRSIQDSLCPFCGTKLSHVKKFVKLTLPVQRKLN